MPAMTRQATVTAPLGSRGPQLRAAEMQRGAPPQRGANRAPDNTDDDERPDDGKESLFGRTEDDMDDTDAKDSGDDGAPNGHDPEEDNDGNANTNPKAQKKT